MPQKQGLGLDHWFKDFNLMHHSCNGPAPLRLLMRLTLRSS